MEVQENIARRGPVIWAEYEAKLDHLDILFSFVGHVFERLSDSKRKGFLRLLKLDAESSNLERIARLRVLSEKAAEQNFALAQFDLGSCYSTGQGVAKDDAEAVKWFRKAADQGLAEAQHNLGVMYANGTGVEKDYAEAVRWYRKAADQGYAQPLWRQSNPRP